MGSFRDGYSNFGFYTAMSARVTSSAAGAANGATIDRQGFETVTFLVNCASYCSGGANGAGDQVELIIQHGLASAAGVSAWSNVPLSLIIHSVEGGYASTAEDGIFQILTSGTSISDSADTYIVGYKGDYNHRYVRFKYSNIGDASSMWLAANCVLGEPANWEVNTPI
jgi:hypothetical protein